MLRLAIIADDLTGALDAAAPFAGRGLRTKVALSPNDIPLDPEVVAISTRSREIAPEAAQAAVAWALAALPHGTPLMKKIDSRMKGNIAAELSAFPKGRLLLAPAIPDFGRITLDGYVTGFGVETPIRAVIAGMECTAPDVATPEQMRSVLAAAGDALPVGARGLAEAMAAALTDRPARPAAVSGPLGVFVIGSRDPITMAQAASLKLPVLQAPNGVVPPLPRTSVAVQAVQGAQHATPAQVAGNLARGLRGIDTDTLFITGGATAEAVLTGLGITVLDLAGECLPGLARGARGGMTIVTKSGGFGAVDTLAELARMIEGGSMNGRKSLAEIVFDRMQRAIKSGSYSADERLPTEHELALEFEVSRPIVREALRRLREQGLVYSRRGAGSFVRSIGLKQPLGFGQLENVADLLNCYEFRVAIEPEAAALAALRHDDAALHAMTVALELMRDATNRQSHREDADFQFHHAIAVASENPYFATSMEALKDHIASGMRFHGASIKMDESGLSRVFAEHGAIHDAIRLRDADKARDLMRRHLLSSQERVFEKRRPAGAVLQ